LIWEVRPSMIVNRLYFFKNMKEIWKDVNNYEGMYQVSNFGNVKKISKVNKYGYETKEKEIKSFFSSHNYKIIKLYKNNKCKTFYIHRLVAIAFIKNHLNKPSVNHIDGIKHNNKINNLEWCTAKENYYHAVHTLKYINKGGSGLIPPNAKKVKDTISGKIYNSASETARLNNMTQVNLCRKLRGERKNNTTFIYV